MRTDILFDRHLSLSACVAAESVPHRPCQNPFHPFPSINYSIALACADIPNYSTRHYNCRSRGITVFVNKVRHFRSSLSQRHEHRAIPPQESTSSMQIEVSDTTVLLVSRLDNHPGPSNNTLLLGRSYCRTQIDFSHSAFLVCSATSGHSPALLLHQLTDILRHRHQLIHPCSDIETALSSAIASGLSHNIPVIRPMLHESTLSSRTTLTP